MNIRMLKYIKEIQYLSPLRRYFFPRYVYNFTAPQICFLCECLNNTRDVPGSIVEVGCAGGSTTIFLNKYMDARKIDKEYFCIDTFSGFVDKDIAHEVAKRGKIKEMYTEGFQVNKKKWFDGTMKSNRIARVHSIQTDVNDFDFTVLGNISFCLLDVDLYRPTKNSLASLFNLLSPQGIMVVDDCSQEDIRWDGADQAYKEFINEVAYPLRIIEEKLGVIIKSI